MEMSQIRYVLAAAEQLNFTKAASACNVSQPALTKAVKALEAELGAQLFHREGRRIQLSEFGQQMVPQLQQIMDQADVAQTLAENFRLLNEVPVRLGVLSTVGHMRVSRFLAKFQKEYEGVEVAVSEDSIEGLKTSLKEGTLDLAILNRFDGVGDELNAIDLYQERYVVVFPPNHAMCEQNAIRLKDLTKQRYVDRLACEMRESVIAVCKEMEVELYARFRSEREEWVQAMVLAKIGFAFMPEYSVTQPELIQRPLVDPEIVRTIALVTVPGRQFSPATAAFIRSAQRFAWPG